MPPEVIAQRNFTHKADMFSMGMTFIEMFSYGKRPLPMFVIIAKTIVFSFPIFKYIKKKTKEDLLQFYREMGCVLIKYPLFPNSLVLLLLPLIHCYRKNRMDAKEYEDFLNKNEEISDPCLQNELIDLGSMQHD